MHNDGNNESGGSGGGSGDGDSHQYCKMPADLMVVSMMGTMVMTTVKTNSYTLETDPGLRKKYLRTRGMVPVRRMAKN